MRHFGVDYDLQLLTSEAMVEYATKAREKRAPVTVILELKVLLQASKAVDLNPPKRPKIRGGAAKRQQPLTREQLQAFYLALHPRQKLLGLALITLGCRASEVAKIDDASIDWAQQTFLMLGTKTKGSKRLLPIPDELFAMMLELRARGEWVGFPKQTSRAVDQIVRKACLRAFGETRSVNDIRGAWSTHAALEGVPVDVRAAFQGNSPEMQHRTYSQPALMPDAMRKAVARGVPRIAPPRAATKVRDG
jgi:integrase